MLLYSSGGLGSVIILFAFKGEGWDATVKCEAIFSLHTEGAPAKITSNNKNSYNDNSKNSSSNNSNSNNFKRS